MFRPEGPGGLGFMDTTDETCDASLMACMAET